MLVSLIYILKEGITKIKLGTNFTVLWFWGISKELPLWVPDAANVHVTSSMWVVLLKSVRLLPCLSTFLHQGPILCKPSSFSPQFCKDVCMGVWLCTSLWRIRGLHLFRYMHPTDDIILSVEWKTQLSLWLTFCVIYIIYTHNKVCNHPSLELNLVKLLLKHNGLQGFVFSSIVL